MRPLTTALCLAGLLFSTATRAEERRDVALTMRGGGSIDAAYLAGAGAMFVAGTFVLEPKLGDRAPLDGLGYRPRNRTFDHLSDVTVGGGLVASVALGGLIERGQGRRGAEAFRAPLVLAEAALMASGVVHMLKNVGGVCRPRDWNPYSRRCEEHGERHERLDDRILEAHRSFPSGHTTPLAAMAGASAGLWLLPTGRRDEFLPLTAVTGSLALAMIAFRPLAGAHSWVDTTTGFVIGSAVGFLTAFLHTRTTSNTTPAESTGQPVSLGGIF